MCVATTLNVNEGHAMLFKMAPPSTDRSSRSNFVFLLLEAAAFKVRPRVCNMVHWLGPSMRACHQNPSQCTRFGPNRIARMMRRQIMWATGLRSYDRCLRQVLAAALLLFDIFPREQLGPNYSCLASELCQKGSKPDVSFRGLHKSKRKMEI